MAKDPAKARKRTSPGHRFPSFQEVALNGRAVTEKDLRERVSVVLLWRSGCHWSQHAFNELIRTDRGRTKFNVLLMAPHSAAQLRIAMDASMTADPDRLLVPFVKDGASAQEQLRDRLGETFGIVDYPLILVVGPDGVIRHREEGMPINTATREADLSAVEHVVDSLSEAMNIGR